MTRMPCHSCKSVNTFHMQYYGEHIYECQECLHLTGQDGLAVKSVMEVSEK